MKPAAILFFGFCMLVMLPCTTVLAKGKAVKEKAPAFKSELDKQAFILRLEDTRNGSYAHWSLFLADGSPDIRARAAMALGRIGDYSATKSLLSLLTDSQAEVREAALFALGEMEDPAGADGLLKFMGQSDAALGEKVLAIEAFGKIHSSLGWRDLLHRMPKPGEDEALSPMAPEEIAATFSALTHFKDYNGAEVISPYLAHSDLQVQMAALFYFSRHKEAAAASTEALKQALLIPDTGALVYGLKALLRSEWINAPKFAYVLLDPARPVTVQIAAIAIFDKHPLQIRKETFEKILNDDSHPYVLGGILEALVKTAPQNYHAVAAALPFLKNSQPQIRISALNVVASHRSWKKEPEGAPKAESVFWENIEAFAGDEAWSARAESAKLLMPVVKLAADESEANRILREKLLGRLNEDSDARVRMEALIASLRLVDYPERSERLLQILAGKDDVLRPVAARELDQLLKTDTEAINKTLKGVISARTRLLVLEALQAALDKASGNIDESEVRMASLDALSNSVTRDFLDIVRKTALADADIQVRRHAAELYERFTGDVLETGTPKLLKKHSLSWYKKILSASPAYAQVETTGGSVFIELFAKEAPLTVNSFAALARKGFYDGTDFHRVVPNFVVQGGDPIGTGWGGPGYNLRCEISTARFERGAVGMAHAGKDTNGSQFFFTHLDMPHLDGGYTVFGRVVRGMEHVDRMTQSDRILRVLLMDELPPEPPAEP